MNNKICIRKITIDDIDKYKSLRLELLLNEPSSFGSSFEEENTSDNSLWIDRLTKPNISSFGAFRYNELVGIVLSVMNPRKKIKHIATLNSLYVKPSYRGQGIAEKLIEKAFSFLNEQCVEIINLSVATKNKKAINLYRKFGFEIYAEEKKAIKLDDEYIDLYLMRKENNVN